MKLNFADVGTMVARRAQKSPPGQGGWQIVHTAHGGVDCTNPATNKAVRANGDEALFGWPNSLNVEAEIAAWFDAKTLDEEFDATTVTIQQRNIGAFLRFWLLKRLWLQGGISSARAISETDAATDSISGVGVSGAAGFEIFSRRKWSLDVALRLSGATYREDSELKSQSVALTAAFNVWF